MTNDSPRVALLGLGIMGQGMARNILRAGLGLNVWNRSPAKALPLADLGAIVARDPAEAVAGTDLVVTMVFDADAVTEVMDQAATRLAPDQIWVQMSTVGAEGTVKLLRDADRYGVTYVDAPVLGTKKPAEDGQLVVLASGPGRALDVCAPLFDAIGSRTIRVGEAGGGSRLKLVANAWVLAVLEGVAESLTMAEALGLRPQLFLDAVSGGALDAPYVQLKGSGMIAQEFPTAFPVDGAAKDAALILAAADGAGVRMDITRIALDRLRNVSGAGHGAEDMSAIVLDDRRI
jgi:3-hydroxyisobutyrate dehydrogenase